MSCIVITAMKKQRKGLKRMDNKDFGKLLDIIKCDTDTLYFRLIQELQDLGLKAEYEYDDWIYVDNGNPIMLVAHIDTITRSKKLKFRIKKDKIMARNSVLGADDRAGVFAILEILARCKRDNVPMPSILFTNYEESGCIGVDNFIKSKKMKENMKFFIEMDREGWNEYVTYYYQVPKEVEDYVESFGYVSDYGSMSDVGSLTEEYDIPHVNVSVGYYNQHTIKEFLVPSQLSWSIDRVYEMVQSPIEELYIVNSYRGDTTNYNQYNYGCYQEYGYGAGSDSRYKDYYPTDHIRNCIDLEDRPEPVQLFYVTTTDLIYEVPFILESADIPWDEYGAEDYSNMEQYDKFDPNTDFETKMEQEYYQTYGWEG